MKTSSKKDLVHTAVVEHLEGHYNARANNNLRGDSNGTSKDSDAIAVAIRGGKTFDASPLANNAINAHDGVQDAGMFLDVDIREDDRVGNADTSINNGTRTDENVGTDFGGGIDFRGRINDDSTRNVRSSSKEFRLGFGVVSKVLLVAVSRRSSALHGSPKLLVLENVGYAICNKGGQNVVFHAQLARVGIARVVEGEEVVFGGSSCNRGGEHLATEKVDSGVNSVRDVAFRLLCVVEHAASLLVSNVATVIHRNLFAYAYTEHSRNFAVGLVELENIFQREGADSVCVQQEEVCHVGRQNLLAEMEEASSGTQSSVFLQVSEEDQLLETEPRGRGEKECSTLGLQG